MLTPKTKMNLQRVLKETVDAELKRIQEVMPSPERIDMRLVEHEVKKKVQEGLYETVDKIVDSVMQKTYAALAEEMNRHGVNEHSDWSVTDVMSVGAGADADAAEMAKDMVRYELQELVGDVIKYVVKGSYRE
jgi:hypothetical protein